MKKLINLVLSFTIPGAERRSKREEIPSTPTAFLGSGLCSIVLTWLELTGTKLKLTSVSLSSMSLTLGWVVKFCGFSTELNCLNHT